jgi:pimeloyl-ACP methyl ester carboxylesterase
MLGLGGLIMLGFSALWFAQPYDVALDEVHAQVPNAAYSRFAIIDGVRIHYQEKGSGPPLVLLHGYCSNTYTWKDVLPALAQQFHVLAVDLKGFGFSEKPRGNYSLNAQADLVMKLLDEVAIPNATIGGNSMGGAVGLLCALNYPERVNRLVLVDGAIFRRMAESGQRLAPPLFLKPVIGPMLTALALTSDTLVRRALELSLYDHSLLTPERLEAYYRPLRTRGGQRAAFEVARQWDLSSAKSNLDRVQSPTLILWGEKDELVPLALGQQLHREMKDSKLVVFENCGHMPQEEQPKRFVEVVSGFLLNNQH